MMAEFSLLLLWLPALTQSLLFVPLDGRSLWDQEGLIINGTWNMWYDNDYCPNGMKLSYRLTPYYRQTFRICSR